jgi:hypothetical protein
MEKGYHQKVDIITCAAPYKPAITTTIVDGEKVQEYADPAVGQLLRNQITWTLRAACENNVDVIVLGAHGCGPFKNPPEVVAQTIKNVLLNPDTGDDWRLAGIKKVIIAVWEFHEPMKMMKIFESVFHPHPQVVVEDLGEAIDKIFTPRGALDHDTAVKLALRPAEIEQEIAYLQEKINKAEERKKQGANQLRPQVRLQNPLRGSKSGQPSQSQNEEGEQAVQPAQGPEQETSQVEEKEKTVHTHGEISQDITHALDAQAQDSSSHIVEAGASRSSVTAPRGVTRAADTGLSEHNKNLLDQQFAFSVSFEDMKDEEHE